MLSSGPTSRVWVRGDGFQPVLFQVCSFLLGPEDGLLGGLLACSF